MVKESDDLHASLVGEGLFGDGTAAITIGADLGPEVEKPLFELVSTAQTILPDSDGDHWWTPSGIEAELKPEKLRASRHVLRSAVTCRGLCVIHFGRDEDEVRRGRAQDHR
ncbi:hypothetical protein C3L33_17421, partial [Rhododendron williamsianum]